MAAAEHLAEEQDSADRIQPYVAMQWGALLHANTS